MSPTHLIDSDVVIKLSRMDAFKDGMTAIGVSAKGAGSLSIMIRAMGLSNSAKRLALTRQNHAEADRLAASLHQLVPIETTEEESQIAAVLMKTILASGLDIQEGELALLVVAACRGGMDFVTGDKRALRELPALAGHWEPLNAMRGRTICLEQIFKRLCSALSFVRIRAAVTTSPQAEPGMTKTYEHASVNGGGPTFVALLDLIIREHIESGTPGWLKAL